MVGESNGSGPLPARRTFGTLVLKKLCSDKLSKFGRAWIALHPNEPKPALLLAQRIGCSERHGNFILRGDRGPSPRAILALNEEIIS